MQDASRSKGSPRLVLEVDLDAGLAAGSVPRTGGTASAMVTGIGGPLSGSISAVERSSEREEGGEAKC